MSSAARKLTYADYERIPADGLRHEILGGEEIVTPAPTPDHQSVIVNLTALLRSHTKAAGAGRVFVAPIDVVLSENDLVQPDLLFVAETHAHIVGPKNIQGPPDLVVEVLSPTTEAIDRGRKKDLYERSGVREYWMVDPARKAVEVHELAAAGRIRSYREGASFESALFPGLTVRLADIF